MSDRLPDDLRALREALHAMTVEEQRGSDPEAKRFDEKARAAESRILSTVAALTADKERLDAMEREGIMVRPVCGWDREFGDYEWQALRRGTEGKWACGKNMRDAIDRARSPEETP